LVCRVFGPHKKAQHDLGPTRLIVRDAPLSKGGELETKTENIIDRKTGAAMHPRKMERVVSGSEFLLKLALQTWDTDTGVPCKFRDDAGKEHTGPAALIEFVRESLRRVQRTGIGSGVSKGSGEIEFRKLKLDGQDITL
jgi:CRISPR-associated protein Csm3